MLVAQIGNGFVDKDAGVVGCMTWEAPHGQIHLLAQDVFPFAVIEHTVIVVRHIAIDFMHGIITFIRKEIVVWIIVSDIRRDGTVVPQTVAEKQEETWQAVCAGPVIEHFEIATIGSSVRRSGRKLIIYMVCTHHLHIQSLNAAMRLGQSLGLGCQRAAGRHDNYHVDVAVGMKILVVHLAHHCR